LFQIYKRLFERQIFLNNQIVLGLVTNRQQLNSNEYTFNDTNKNKGIINGLNLTLASVLDFIIQNVIETLNQIKSESLNLTHFKQLKSILDNYLKWLNLENLNSLMSPVKDSKIFSNDDLLEKYNESIAFFEKSFTKIPQYKLEREKSKKKTKIEINFIETFRFFFCFF